MNITSTSFINNYAGKSGGAIYISNNLDFRVNASTFSQNGADSYGSDIYSLFSNYYLTIDSSFFYNSSPVSSIYAETTYLKITSTLYSANTGISDFGGAVTCMNCIKIVITSSIFDSFEGKEAGAIYIEQSENSKNNPKYSAYNISSSTFINNQAIHGGGLSIINIEYGNLTSNIFKNNTAKNNSELNLPGYGGGIYFTCDISNDCKVVMSGNN